MTADERELPVVAPLMDQSLSNDLKSTEKKRIQYRRRPCDGPPLGCRTLIDFVWSRPGPRLVIMNTVQTAAVIADAMRDAGKNVLHLSTALAPIHREAVIQRVKWRLRDKITDWALVATSCVEAGIDFSFHTGFRERGSTASLIQVGGRVNRGNEFDDSEVWDILLRDELFKDNPALAVPIRVLARFSLGELNETPPSTLASRAMQRELTEGGRIKAQQLLEAEVKMEYPDVSDRCKVIESETQTVVVDRAIAESIRRRQRVSKAELLAYSVQIWGNKVHALGFEQISDDREIFCCVECYDSEFLGCMDAVLKNERFMADPNAYVI